MVDIVRRRRRRRRSLPRVTDAGRVQLLTHPSRGLPGWVLAVILMFVNRRVGCDSMVCCSLKGHDLCDRAGRAPDVKGAVDQRIDQAVGHAEEEDVLHQLLADLKRRVRFIIP